MSRDDLVCGLSALQLADSSFPSGRYTLSHGLESVTQESPLSVDEFASLLGNTIRLAVAPSDGVALACAHRAVSDDGSLDKDLVMRADQRLTAVKLARETREASTRTGRALMRTVSAIAPLPPLLEFAHLVDEGSSPGNHSIVFGVVSAAMGVRRLAAVLSDLYAFCASWVAAGVRLGSLDHCTAQRVLFDIRTATARAARASVDGDVPTISSCAPFLDVMSMRHEQAEIRLFAS